MTATDLALGDWVYNSSKEKCKVYAISNMFDSNIHLDNYDKPNDGCFELVFEVEPIPLTPEILEKNGWKLHDLEDIDWLMYDYSTDCQNVRISENDTYGYKWWIAVSNILGEDESGFKDRNHAGIYCNYVHQLQHALKLCGINKEIVL